MRTRLIDRLRLRFGLRWPSRRKVGSAFATAGVLAVILLGYGIVGRIDYEVERAAAQERARPQPAPVKSLKLRKCVVA